jgi:hypothetical protein
MSMKNLVTVLAIVLIAAVANAGVISDLQQGAFAEGDLIQVSNAVVTGAAFNGVFISELPVGPYSGVWVYLDSDHGILDGDVVNVIGVYEEYFGLTEINVPAAAENGLIEVVGQQAVPAPVSLTMAELLIDPEIYESVPVCLTDGMSVLEAPNDFGEWLVGSLESADELLFNDYFYDDTTVELGQCYNSACGVLNYSFGAFKLEAYADGIDVTDCTVPVEGSSLTSIKGLFR